MYTASGGYYLDGQAFSSKKNNKKSGFRMIRLCFLLILFIGSFLFGAMMHAYAINDQHNELPIIESKSTYDPYIVRKGESLWTIAQSHVSPDTDIRKYIHQIKSFNHLKTSILQEGQILLLPDVL